MKEINTWVVTGVFAAIWGSIEIVIGSYLHLIEAAHPFPFHITGPIMVLFGMGICSVTRTIYKKAGMQSGMGLICGLLKLLSVGGVKLPPMIAILIEAALFDGIVTLLGLFMASERIKHITGGVIAGFVGTGMMWILFTQIFGVPMAVTFFFLALAGVTGSLGAIMGGFGAHLGVIIGERAKEARFV
jgi:hypothetical protein